MRTDTQTHALAHAPTQTYTHTQRMHTYIHAQNFFRAGTDTTAAALCWTIIEVGNQKSKIHAFEISPAPAAAVAP